MSNSDDWDEFDEDGYNRFGYDRNGKTREGLTREEVQEKVEKEEEVPEFEGDVKKATKEKYSEIEGKKMSLLMDNGFNVIRKVSNIDLIGTLKRSRKKVFAVIIDGAATKPIVKFCEDNGGSHIGAKNFSAMETDINLISL